MVMHTLEKTVVLPPLTDPRQVCRFQTLYCPVSVHYLEIEYNIAPHIVK